MKAIILAAGRGSRLKGESHLPKPLTLLENGMTILAWQLRNLGAHFRLSDIRIVVGYMKERIIELDPTLSYIEAPSYAKQNTSQSLLGAIRDLDEDVFWLNGDVIFHPDIIEKVVAFGKSCMVVIPGQVGEEEIKYRSDGRGRITEVSKKIAGEGEAVGINFVSKRDLPLLIQGLQQCGQQDYFEKGIEWAIGRGLEIYPLAVDASQCTEIDFAEDLERANALIRSWKSKAG